MLDQEKLSREEILKELDISEDTLSLYEHELEINTDLTSGELKSFTQEDFQSIKVFHKLRESGLTYNEIKLLTSFSDILKNVDFDGKNEVKNLLRLSPLYRLKQSLNLSRQELNLLRNKVKELEETIKKELENKPFSENADVASLQKELEIKQKAVNNLDRQLSEALQQKTQLETQLATYRDGKTPQIQIKGKKAKELYNELVQKELEIAELKKENEKLSNDLSLSTDEVSELSERLELMEDGITEMEHEVEERYQEQIESLKEQIESLVDRKQQEWEKFYVQSGEQHKKELLTLQKRHEQELIRLKIKIKEQFEEIQNLKNFPNPLMSLLKMGSGR